MRNGRSGTSFLAFDLGAESGRAILGKFHSGILSLEEIHRFANEPVEYGGSQHWDVPRLWREIRCGLAAVEESELAGIGVDAWGVDYALLGERGELLQNPYHYRDPRTGGMMVEAFRTIPREEIYRLTGIQFLPFNTLYQLMATRRDTPEILAAAKRFLTIPDLFHFWLSAIAVCEYTNVTTTQMMNPVAHQWAPALLELAGLSASLPAPLVEPGTVIGPLAPRVSRTSALTGVPVIAPASHDTASAVAAVSARDETAFLSSGTWSLLGTEIDAPVLTSESLRRNFTNEGGVCGTTRLLKNVMGLWLLQSCRRCWADRGIACEYDELMGMAQAATPLAHLFDPDDPSFLNPVNMLEAIDGFCVNTDQQVPRTSGAYARAVLESLAFKYRLVLEDLELVSGRRIEQIRVLGGGSKNRLLNQFTADATQRRVLAGPVEATAIGNIAVQMLAIGAVSSLKEARIIVERSFPIEIFEPLNCERWEREAERFRQYCEIIDVRN
jgi:rhamnulokinase